METRPQFARRWYTTREVAQILGFSTTKVKMLIAQRDLRSVKIGGSRRILPEWVDEFIDNVTHATRHDCPETRSR